MKMWSGRFGRALDADFEAWQRSFDFDQRLLAFELDSSKAHARALKSAEILTSDELIAIVEGLEKVREQAQRSPEVLSDPKAEDVHHFVERQLVKCIGETGYKLHSGRSRNEQIAADLRLYVRASIDQHCRDLGDLALAFVERAEQSRNSVMPAYTHLQRAEPVLVAHWLLAYVEMFLRDANRLGDCRKRVNLCPLGSGAVAGSTLPLDRRAMAADLEFDGITSNSIDATSDRDFVIEFVNSLATLTLHLSRWAEEMILFSSREFGFVELPEQFSTGSSAMPQKKNPDLLELVRAKSAGVMGNAIMLMVSIKGLPLAYNKDLQEAQGPLYQAVEAVLAMLPLVTRWMKVVEFNFEAMQRSATDGFMNAWAAAMYLVQRGVPFRLAHEQVGNLVQLCLQKNCTLQNLSVEELRSVHAAFDESFYGCLALDRVLAIHDVPGGTAPARVRQGLTDAKRRAQSLFKEAHAHA